MDNAAQTIISQYASSPTICTLIDAWNQCIDPTAGIDAFYDLIWNVETAQGYGLDVWGRIVGISRVLTITEDLFWGFSESGNTSAAPFGQGPFYNGLVVTANYALTDDAFRTLIYARAMANITDGSVLGLNAILMTLFAGRGNAWVADGGDMTMTYSFDFALTPVEISIVEASGVLPRPAGVAVAYRMEAS
ncbi:DUF2612 domain-containing protein [Novacetimonas pomaceti]|uniref:DUF2612 domain-containing protein n=1 Tax=Novacetimonas pomaceti TaxID=2021998 RepID=A0ABX5P159_9PROT|nr:DUF2612 domain-containing protein [Novacetimonas pomaceti]PYD47181.1 DUF2612 domain-containing protein [Novacetimonas pomaceti]